MDFGEVGIKRKYSSTRCEEIVNGNLHGGSCFHGGSTEKVDDEGFDKGSLTDLTEFGLDIDGVGFDEVKCGGDFALGGGVVNGDGRETVEDDGRVGS